MLYIATEEVGDVYTLFPGRFIEFNLGCNIRLFFSYVNSNCRFFNFGIFFIKSWTTDSFVILENAIASKKTRRYQ